MMHRKAILTPWVWGFSRVLPQISWHRPSVLRTPVLVPFPRFQTTPPPRHWATVSHSGGQEAGSQEEVWLCDGERAADPAEQGPNCDSGSATTFFCGFSVPLVTRAVKMGI